MPHLFFTLCVLCLFVFSNTNVTLFYYVSAFLVLFGPFLLFFKGAVRDKLDRNEVIFVVGLFTYAAIACVSMLINGGWNWSDFNEPSKFLLIILLFLAIRSHGFNEKYLFFANVTGLVGATVFAYYQAEILNINRVYGSTNKIIAAFGLIALISGFFALVYLVMNKHSVKWRYILGSFVAAAMLYTIAATGTKGVWIALPAVLVLLVLAKIDSNKWLLLSVTGLGFAAIGVVFFFNDMANSRLQGLWQPLITYVQTGQITDGSLSIRLETWKAAFIMGVEFPVFGVGLGNFVTTKADLIASGVIDPAAGFVMGPHNDLIGTFAVQGLLGLAALVFLYVSFFRLCLAYKHFSTELFWCASGLISIYLLSGLAGDRISSNLTATYLAMTMAIIVGQMSYKYRMVKTINKEVD